MKQLAWIFVILLTVTTVLFAVDALTIGPNGVITVRVHGRDQTLDSALAPVGTINAYGGTIDPDDGGWLICDGRALSSLDHPELYAVIGTSFGNGSTDGDGNPASGDFNLPDMRGRFARGLDARSGRDPDLSIRRNIQDDPQTGVGGIQDDAFQGHWHNLVNGSGVELKTTRQGLSNFNNSLSDAVVSPTTTWRAGDAVPDSTGNPPRTSTETRPQNVAVNYIIKY